MKMVVHYAVMLLPPVDVFRLETCQLQAKDLLGLLAILYIVFCEVKRHKFVMTQSLLLAD